MITFTYTLGIVLVMLGVWAAIEMVRQLSNTGDPRWVLMLLAISAFLISGLTMSCYEPTDGDVLKGKAHYVKVVHYDGEDEIVTYRIEWNSKKSE